MRYWKFIALATLVLVLLSIPRPAHAQVSVNIGAAPDCPYGYYDVAPYNCAPIRVLRDRVVQRWRFHRSRPFVPRRPRLPGPR